MPDKWGKWQNIFISYYACSAAGIVLQESESVMDIWKLWLEDLPPCRYKGIYRLTAILSNRWRILRRGIIWANTRTNRLQPQKVRRRGRRRGSSRFLERSRRFRCRARKGKGRSWTQSQSRRISRRKQKIQSPTCRGQAGRESASTRRGQRWE